MMTEKPCPTDLNDGEWALIEPLLGRKRGRGHEQGYSLWRIVEASFYVRRGWLGLHPPGNTAAPVIDSQ